MSEVKVNKISPRTACGTVTLGDSGDTFTIPAGATITNSGTAAGFGATGAVSWDTTAKTTGFTAVDGVGYFVNTTAGAITVTLPLSPAAGAVIGVSDYANIFATNNLTLDRNGSNIGGVAADSVLVVNGAAVTLVYVDATKGWIVTDSGLQSDASEEVLYVTATGGTITCSGDYRIHTFTGPGTLCVSCAGNAVGSNSVDYLVVAGAGGGSGGGGGGGGAGGFRESSGVASGGYSASPLGSGVSALPVSVQGYTVTVGGGNTGVPYGTADASPGNGSNSVFSTITSTGGGAGAGGGAPTAVGRPGGSGGGGNGGWSTAGGTGNTPPVSPSQGNNGGQAGNATNYKGGGGGGASSVGQAYNATPTAGPGGNGVTSSINGSAVARAGGGGGGTEGPSSGGSAGSGGGGAGATANLAGTNGTTNTGGGGGGSSFSCAAASTGGSGIVIIRYKFQN